MSEIILNSSVQLVTEKNALLIEVDKNFSYSDEERKLLRNYVEKYFLLYKVLVKTHELVESLYYQDQQALYMTLNACRLNAFTNNDGSKWGLEQIQLELNVELSFYFELLHYPKRIFKIISNQLCSNLWNQNYQKKLNRTWVLEKEFCNIKYEDCLLLHREVASAVNRMQEGKLHGYTRGFYEGVITK